MTEAHRRFFQWSLAVALTVTVFWFLFGAVPIAQIAEELGGLEPGLLALALGLSVLTNVFVTSLRWARILRRLGHRVPLRAILFVKLASDPITTVTPLRAGEVSRPAYLRRVHDIPVGAGVFSVAVEYLLNVLTFVLLGIAGGLWALGAGTLRAPEASRNLGATPLFAGMFADALRRLPARIRQHADDLRTVLEDVPIVVMSLAFCVGDVVSVWLLSHALHCPLPFSTALLATPVIVLVSALPFTVAGLGVREGLFVLFLRGHADPVSLLSLGLLFSFVEHLFPMMLGLPFLTGFLRRTMRGRSGPR